MKKLKNKNTYAEVDFSINLSVSYDDDYGELVELEDVKALDFLEKYGYDEYVMEEIWADIVKENLWGLFDIEYEGGKWASIKWDICDNVFTVSYDDGDGDDYIELTFKEFYNEFFTMFEGYIQYTANIPDYRIKLFHYWDIFDNLENYPDIIRAIENQ